MLNRRHSLPSRCTTVLHLYARYRPAVWSYPEWLLYGSKMCGTVSMAHKLVEEGSQVINTAAAVSICSQSSANARKAKGQAWLRVKAVVGCVQELAHVPDLQKWWSMPCWTSEADGQVRAACPTFAGQHVESVTHSSCSSKHVAGTQTPVCNPLVVYMSASKCKQIEPQSCQHDAGWG